ncbi:hypothetical protein JCM5353_000998 [Sporobolomyces roseus]
MTSSSSSSATTPLLGKQDSSTSSSTSASPTVKMLNRSQVREKNVLDEMELVENGNTGGLTGKRELASVAIGNPDKADPPMTGGSGVLSVRDKRALALLVALYLLQGIPVGLAFGSIPFLLRSKLSYSQIGIFTLCTYPYSLKLLWSPIVDSIFSPKLGRRKSWIVPIQTIVGLMFWWLGNNVQQMMEVEEPNVNTLTALFFTLVFFAATQDIAVDGKLEPSTLSHY